MAHTHYTLHAISAVQRPGSSVPSCQLFPVLPWHLPSHLGPCCLRAPAGLPAATVPPLDTVRVCHSFHSNISIESSPPSNLEKWGIDDFCNAAIEPYLNSQIVQSLNQDHNCASNPISMKKFPSCFQQCEKGGPHGYHVVSSSPPRGRESRDEVLKG